jgi:multidrug resistance efflux pump
MMQLDNFTLDQQISGLQIDIQENRLLAQLALASDDTAGYATLNKVMNKKTAILQDLERQYQHLSIYAPFAGMLEEPLTSLENTFINLGQTLGNFINPDVFKATVDVIERDMQEIKIGTKAHLSLDVKPENLYWGEVTSIAQIPISKGIARLYNITVTFPNDTLLLRKGLNGTVMLYAGKATFFQKWWLWLQKTVRLDLQF